jgi:hypothetical protein
MKVNFVMHLIILISYCECWYFFLSS